MCSWVSFLVLILCFSFNLDSDAARYRKEQNSAAILVGTVYRDTRFHQQLSKTTHFIPGAIVVVECGHDKTKFREEVMTNEKGDFEVKLPVYISKNVKKIKGCWFKIVSSGCPYCSVATTQQIYLKSKKAGTRIFSAGFFTIKLELCNQKDIKGKLSESDKLSDKKVFGFPPNPFQPPSLFPPPSLVPPLPFQPTPPSLIPPLIPSPPPTSIFPPFPQFPPLPGLIPSPPPPPPPTFPIPLPPLPPIPGFPTVPPASTKTNP